MARTPAVGKSFAPFALLMTGRAVAVQCVSVGARLRRDDDHSARCVHHGPERQVVPLRAGEPDRYSVGAPFGAF